MKKDKNLKQDRYFDIRYSLFKRSIFVLQKRATMETLIVHLENAKKAKVLKSVMEVMGVPFEIKKKKQTRKAAKIHKGSPYNPEFVAKIKEGEADYKAGRFKAIKTADLWK